MKTATDIISDADIERVHGNANFGGTDKRRVVNGALLQTVLGFSTGWTAETILREHGLITSRRPGQRKPPALTVKGYDYLRAVSASHVSDMANLIS